MNLQAIVGSSRADISIGHACIGAGDKEPVYIINTYKNVPLTAHLEVHLFFTGPDQDLFLKIQSNSYICNQLC